MSYNYEKEREKERKKEGEREKNCISVGSDIWENAIFLLHTRLSSFGGS